MKKQEGFEKGAVRYLICTLISLAAGIASAGLFFAKWVTVVGETYSVPQFYRAATELQTQLNELIAQVTEAFGEVSLNTAGLDQVRVAAVVFMAVAGVIVLLQVIYVGKILFGNGGRPLGIAAGVLTAVLSLGAVAALFWMNSRLNTAMAPLNEVLGALGGLYNEFAGGLNSLFPSLGLETSNMTIDANDLIQTTVFPYVTAALGAVEAIFAR